MIKSKDYVKLRNLIDEGKIILTKKLRNFLDKGEIVPTELVVLWKTFDEPIGVLYDCSE